jgi:excisionase family DNA binding protein
MNETSGRSYTKQQVYARGVVAKALLRGWIQRRPCETCGDEPADAHHDDYSMPLEVRWLCPSHHHLQHVGQDRVLAWPRGEEPEPAKDPRMLTVKQVAERLQIGQVTVLRWLRSGKLTGVKPGGSRIGWRVPVSEVERVERGE